MNTFIENFTNLFEVQRTLKFKLIPDENTKKYLSENQKNDYLRSKNYHIVKDLIDDAYRKCIEHCFSNLEINFEPLYNALIKEDNINTEKEEKKCIKALDDKIKKSDEYKSLEKSKFLNTLLNDPDITEEEKKVLSTFNDFTTYFVGFYENRSNIFSTEDIATSLYNRIVRENFTTYVSNKKSFDLIIREKRDIVDKVEENLKRFNIISASESLEKDYFSVNSYNKYITQEGIDLYNKILGGFEENGKKYTGLNEEINLYSQKEKDYSLRKLLQLKKQILSKRKNKFIEIIETDEELYKMIESSIIKTKESNLFVNIRKLFDSICKYNLEQIYISTDAINRISSIMYKDYSRITRLLRSLMEKDLLEKNQKKKLTKKEAALLDKKLGISSQETEVSMQRTNVMSLQYLIKNLSSYDINILDEYKKLLFEKLDEEIDAFDKLEKKMSEDKNIIKKKDVVEVFKNFVDANQNVLHIIKYLNSKEQVNIDTNFYSEYSDILDILSYNNKVLNLVRNYVTKVSHNTNKIKLNFDIPTLASGWSKSKEKDNRSIILKKNGAYYLGILKHKIKIDFSKIKEGSENYDKMEYYLFPGPNKMLPKCMLPKEVKNHFKENSSDYSLFNENFIKPFIVTKELCDAYTIEYDGKKKFQKDYLKKHPEDLEGHKKSLRIAIDGCKEFLKLYKSTLEFDYSNLKNAEEYNDISEFYN